MKMIQGLVIDPDPESDWLMRAKLENFISRPANQRRLVRLHIGLVIYALPEKIIKKVTDNLDQLAQQLTPVEIVLGKIKRYGRWYLGFDLESPALRQMHENTTDFLAPIVQGYFNRKYLEDGLNEKQTFYLKNYGYHRIKEYFEPHLTIGKYETEQIRDSEIQFAPQEMNDKLLFNKLVLDNSEAGSPIPSKIIWEKTLET